MPRLFAAFTLPDDARAEVARVSRSVDLRGVSWVVAENLHITHAFFGNRNDTGAIVGALAAGARECAPAHVRLGMLDGFPSSHRASVVWVGVSDPTGVLADDAARLLRALGASGLSGFGVERAYVPHITVARVHRRRRGDVEVPRGVVPAPVSFTVSSVELYESVLRGGRPPRYEVLASLRFSASAASS